MYMVKIKNEYLHGPIWVYGEDGIVVRNFPLIDFDEQLSQLNKQVEEMFSAYYEFDSHDQTCWFNEEKEKAEREMMVKLISRIVTRLAEINDGSFVVQDYVTPQLLAE